jgi:hypothetical protein
MQYNKPSYVNFSELDNKYTVLTHKNEIKYFDTYQEALEISLECFLYYTESLENKIVALEDRLSMLINR